ncbi:oligo-1,6-glucosidase [Pseudobutyrivibrio sp. 49]|uniref:glycoside hydrolase family 13 protein n=1 Tax=Pseudobutyrivibrio sp. 49 TaxID=1855344 RepID=UPI00087EE5BC|nr:alpha-glucosidase [Pseudobutyrivibrio sp. 49]SDI31794.1 oligo-1,6-glucosidase [Pseudobutyrivibrio sp. 49]
MGFILRMSIWGNDMAAAGTKKWWKNAIVYQIYPRSFCDSNGDGIGDIPGIISKLNYLKNLGVDVIWLSPVYPSPGYDNGYDISEYKGINPEFGTMEDMERLISRAKRLGIRIIMDLVINHTSDEHEWFKKALAGDPKYRKYYLFSDKPNNWGSFFGNRTWTKTENGDYYLHLFSEKQPDLNWQNPDVYDEIADVMRFWLDKGISGFRCDVINIIYKNSLSNGRRRLILTGREHYLNTEGCHELLQRFNKEIWSNYKTFIVGETILVTPNEAKLLCDENRGELDAIFFFEHMDVDSRGGVKWLKKRYKPDKLIRILDKWQNALEIPANYLENHDQVRSVNHFGNTKEYWEKSAKLLCGLNLSLKGIPFIFEGEEIGMTNGDFRGLRDIKDIESYNINQAMKRMLLTHKLRRKLILRTSRDNARTPVQWDSSENAGFTSGEPWLRINENKSYINVETETEDENSILNFYKQMIDFRKNSKALSEGTYRKVAAPSDVYIFTREAKDERLYIYCNLSSSNRSVEFYGDRIIFGNYPSVERDNQYLKPYEFRIIASNI